MEAIKGLNIEAFKYLDAIPPCNWSRHAFGTSSKSGMLLNNCCESFNNVLRDARSKPILSLMEWIRRYVMKRCCAKRNGLKSFDGVIMPSVVKMIHNGLLQVSKMKINQAGLHEFEVDDDGDTFVVNLKNKVCGCYRWSLMGIPCWHALACIVKRRLQYEEFVHVAYHVSTYAATYSPAFKAMPGHTQWDTTPQPHPLPPPYRKMPGRPSKRKRVKEPGEDKEKKLVKRAKKNNRCSRCGGLGHYKPKCQNVPLSDANTRNKGGRPSSSTASLGQSNAATLSQSQATQTSDETTLSQSQSQAPAPPQAPTPMQAPKKTTKKVAAPKQATSKKGATAPSSKKGPVSKMAKKFSSISAPISQSRQIGSTFVASSHVTDLGS